MPDELSAPAPRRGPRARTLLAVALFGLLAGGGAVVGISTLVGPYALHGFHLVPRAGLFAPMPAAMPDAPDPVSLARVAALEARLDRIENEANSEEANAARAEALLVAFAARRAIDRGAPLGYLDDQLHLRFGDALPNAVAMLTAAGKAPLTLDQLTARLLQIGPQLSGTAAPPSSWSRFADSVSNLFVLHREAAPGPSAETRLDHALLCLREGRVDDAVADVQRLPNGAAAQGWIAEARHYGDVQRALDLLETTALLEPRQLRDAGGKPLAQTPPFAPAAPGPQPASAPSSPAAAPAVPR